MKRPSLLSGVAFAFAIAVFTVPVTWILKGSFSYSSTLRTVLIVGYVAYSLYLVLATGRRVGALTLSASNLAVAIGLLSLPLGYLTVANVLAVLVTLNRSLLCHRSIVSIALDGLISGLGYAFAAYLFTSTWAIPAVLWGYFLFQSIFVLIPPRFAESSLVVLPVEKTHEDPFQHSQRQAEAVLQRIAQKDIC